MEIGIKRRFRSTQERRQIVEETMKPGASVSLVARAHNVNANQVFHWRKQYREGRFNVPSDGSSELVPVRVVPEASKGLMERRRTSRQSSSRSEGAIEITWG